MNNTQAHRLTDARRWRAVTERDQRFDGQFVQAVRTTGIYCRPSCPARHPKRENVVFYPTPADAAAAGFRACRRCLPDQQGIEQKRMNAIASACAVIEQSDEPPVTAELAAAVGMSSSHFHRQFKRLVGVTPREYAAGRRVQRLQEKLVTGAKVTEAIYSAGFGSGTRAYAASKATLGMTPSKYRAGGENIAIEYAIARSALGWLLVAATAEGVCRIEFGATKAQLRERVRDRFPAAKTVADSAPLQEWIDLIVRYIELPTQGLELPMHVQGTAFQRRVWRALQAVPRGATATYKDIAQAIGQPAAVRAVAQACGANKLAVAIPCHRVVRSDGGLGGYKWGIERKEELLERERTSEPARADG